MDLNISNNILYFYKYLLNFLDCDSMIISPSSVSASREAPCDKRNLKKRVVLNNSINQIAVVVLVNNSGH